MTTPENAALSARELAHTSGVYPIRDIAIVRGQGAHLFDADGRRYVDCASGQGVAALGHAHPRVVEAVQRQVATLVTCSGSFPNDRRAALQERLCGLLPEGFERVFLCNSGTEAMEGALKFARLSTGRTGIVAAERGFHGRTMGALSCTWDPKYREPFAPLVPGVAHAVHDDLASFEALVSGDTAAVVVEVVQGEGGVRPAGGEFLRGLRRLCDERGALLVVDEVQTGFGRTGRMFAFEHHGVRPDLLALGKAIGGGLPMGAVALGPRVAELSVGSHGSTFGGNPLACAASEAALEALVEERLPERAEALGARLRARLRTIPSPRIQEVRGLGLMVALELDVPSAPYLAALLERGVIALAAGPKVIRLLPPLVIEEEDLDLVAGALEAVLTREGAALEGASGGRG
jgi:acetylornithine/LysW-gamma-L-lysine aminotransferase